DGRIAEPGTGLAPADDRIADPGTRIATTEPADAAADHPAEIASGPDASADRLAMAATPGGDANRADAPPAEAAPATGRAEPAVVAKATPAKRTPVTPKPHVPTVAVVSSGDDVISGPAEEALGDLLRGRGVRVIDGGRAGGDRPDLGALRGRADAVVFVHARPVGSQEMFYYGQSSTLYTVQLGVKAYKVANGEVLWSSGSEQVNFTTLTAAAQPREAIGPMLDSVDANLDEFRPRGGRG